MKQRGKTVPMRVGLSVIVAATSAAASAGPASAAPASGTVAAVTHSTSVTRLGGWTVWSSYTARAGYSLTGQTTGGTPQALPVPPRKVPFDADLGRDAQGHLVVAYSRCKTEPRGVWSASTYLPLRVEGKGCDIYEYRQGAKSERRVTSVSSRQSSETFPSISGGRLAFVRVAPRRSGQSYRASVKVATLTGHRKITTLQAGPTGTEGLPGPSGLDLNGRRVALTWASRNKTASATGAFASDSRLIVDTVGGSSRLVKRVAQGGESSLLLHSPTIDGGAVYWTAEGYGRPNTFGRASLTTGKVTSAAAPLYVTGLAADAGTFAVVVAPGNPTTGASPTCTGTHAPVVTEGEARSTSCDIQTLTGITFR